MADRTRDVLNTISGLLLRCWIGGFLLLFIWLAVTQLMSDFIYKLHVSMFGISNHELDLIFYCGMGLLKLGVLTLFFIPWIAIKLVVTGQTSNNDAN